MEPIEQMKSAYSICRQEIQTLLSNLNNFLYESAEALNVIENEIRDADSINGMQSKPNIYSVSKLLKYDRFMTNVGTVTNWSRKLNIFLQYNKFANIPALEQLTILHSQIDNTDINNIVNDNYVRANRSNENMKCLEDSKINDRHFNDTDALNLKQFYNGCEFKAIVSSFPYKNSLTFYASLLTKSDIMKFHGKDKFEPLDTKPPPNRVFGIVIGGQETIVRASLINEDQLVLIDFGDIMRIDDNIRFYHLPDDIAELPGYAVKCLLVGVNEYEESEGNDILHMLNILNENFMKEVHVKVVRQQNGVLHVRLLEKCFFERQQMVARRANVFYDNYVEETYANCEDITENELHEVYVTHIEGISFYGQLLKNEDNVMKKYVWIDEEVPPYEKLVDAPKLNDLVLARYDMDKKWYRAIVEEYKKDTNSYKVFYVDFGNREYVPFASLAKCYISELMQPFLAILFVMDGLLDITVGDYAYQQKASDILRCIVDEQITVLVVQNNEKFCSIQLVDERFKNIPQILINEGYAIHNNIFS